MNNRVLVASALAAEVKTRLEHLNILLLRLLKVKIIQKLLIGGV